jgi:FHS family L-fucose permease-like MFS transporter
MQQRSPYLVPLILVTSLFFLWGLSYGLLDVLNKHFQETLNITRQRSTLLQAAYFGAYFLAALPAGLFMNRVGYKKGIIAGLLLYAIGALLFYPSATQASFPFFLASLFILASGLTFLETAANPYVTVLGDPKTSEFRLNLSQSFNGVGSFIGPIIGGAVFFGSGTGSGADGLGSVKIVYIGIAAVVLLVALLFMRTPMPEIHEEEQLDAQHAGHRIRLWGQSHFRGAVITQFFYVAAQVGIAALFINYCTEQGVGISNETASYFLSASLFIFTFGRFVGTAIMKRVAPSKLLWIYGLINILLCLVVVFMKGKLPIYALMAIFYFESIMFPTIFALGVKQLGSETKRGASFIIMSIAGGAIMPYLMGWIADQYSTATAYLVPVLCFAVVVWYGLSGSRVKPVTE